jgi:hypothetical protein
VTGQLAVPCLTKQDTSIYRCIATVTGIGTDSKTIPITVVKSGKCALTSNLVVVHMHVQVRCEFFAALKFDMKDHTLFEIC